jgi:hypothetical protein
VILQPFDTRGNETYPYLWVITGDPRYLGHKTQTIAFEPSIDWVARVVHSMGGSIGTHMVLHVPSWDLVVKSWS